MKGHLQGPLQPCSRVTGTCTTQNTWKLTLQVGTVRLHRQWHKCDSHGGVLPLGNSHQPSTKGLHSITCEQLHIGLFRLFSIFASLSSDYGLPSLCVPEKFVWMHFQRVSGALLGHLSHTVTLKKLCGARKVFRKLFAALMKGITGSKMFGGPVF